MRCSVFLGGSALGWLSLRPTVAQAHLVSTGLGPIYDGVSHLFVSIEDLLPVIAIALLTDLRLAPLAVTTLALAVGLAHGWRNGTAIAQAGLPASELVGITGAVFVVAALVSAPVVAVRAPWTRIAVRAAGSWIAATGLLLAGWSLSGRL